MRIAIRVDASAQIGTGHFMRCLTLANALAKRAVKVRFVSRHMPAYLREMLEEKGYEWTGCEQHPLAGAIDELVHSSWLGVSQQVDARDTIKALQDAVWDCLIVDHYALDARWERMLRASARHIFALDDLADRAHDCDILLDQNFYEDMAARYIKRVSAQCKLLLGPRYVLLREEFNTLRNSARIRSGKVERLLVVFGGVDADNYTGQVLRALENLKPAMLAVDVVIGAQHPQREHIIAACARLSYVCHVQTKRMAELMLQADLAIGACGFTSYEFAAMQLPAILIPVTAIQEIVAKGLANRGVAYALTLPGKDAVAGIAAALARVMEAAHERAAMSLACKNFLDAEGVNRVADSILELKDSHE